MFLVGGIGIRVPLAMLLGCSVLLTGCASSSPVPAATIGRASPTEGTDTAVPMRTIAPSPSPGPTPQSSEPPTVSPTPTVISTLTPSQTRELFRDLAESSMPCELPCWWGIVPGRTSWQAAKDRLEAAGLGTVSIAGDDGSRVHGTSYEVRGDTGQMYRVVLTSFGTDGLVERIDVRAEAYGGESSELLADDWELLSFDQVLSLHGKPCCEPWIGFEGPIEPGAPASYHLLLQYDSQGFRIGYTGPAAYEPPVMRACFRFEEVLRVQLELGGSAWDPMKGPEDGPSTEDLIGMDGDSFYDVLLHPGDQTCVETSVAAWSP